jgi:hypothetical protein
MRVRDAAPINDYLRTLGAALRGPSRLKAELLAEARGSLENAADAYTGRAPPRRNGQAGACGGPSAPRNRPIVELNSCQLARSPVSARRPAPVRR